MTTGMTPIVWTYVAYLLAGITVTCWVAKTQRTHGSTFARTGDRYDSETGPAMCHLLVVGFCLVSFGLLSLMMGTGGNGQTLQACIELVSSKLGWVIMAIGAMHFAMLSVFAAMGRRIDGTFSRPADGATHSVAEIVARKTEAQGH